MRRIKINVWCVCVVVAAFSAEAFGQNLSAYDVSANKTLTWEEFIQNAPEADYVVLGEKHYSEQVQRTEGMIIRDLSYQWQLSGNFSVAWEFLDSRDQASIDHLYAKVRSGEISSEQFLNAFFSNSDSGLYAPVIDASVASGAYFMGTNLSREQKRPVVLFGMDGLAPELTPSDFMLGSSLYKERFLTAIGGHAGGIFDNYYEAQCLTDNAIAEVVVAGDQGNTAILIIGSFHSDYGDGVVAELKRRDPTARVLNLKLVERSDLSPSVDFQSLSYDPVYGALADYLIVID